MKKLTPTLTGNVYNYDKNLSIIDYIQLQAEKYSSHSALIDHNNSLTYKQIFEKASAVKIQLENRGLKKGDKIAILVEPSNELIILIIATLMLGATYILVDTEFPKKRIEYILQDSKPKLLIQKSSKHFNATIAIISLKEINFDEKCKIKKTGVKGNEAAYIIYTSGSTGEPKGIIIPHKAVNNHMLWMISQFKLTQQDRFLLKTGVAFDASVWEIFLPLYLGATLIIAKAGTHSDPLKILKYIDTYQVSVLQVVPLIFYRILKSEIKINSSLRYIFVGGESLPTKTKELFFSKNYEIKLINLYGPAESTIDTTFCEVKNNKKHITHNYIGKPIYNTNLYIFNEKGQTCDYNEVGELYIEGDGVGLGYVNKKVLTKKYFFITQHKKSTFYRTGDLVKLNKNNILEYVGRIDNQIKLNGVRIEIEEIKKEINSLEEVYECVIEKEYDESNHLSILSCYLLPTDSALDIDKIKLKLRKRLPKFMIPSNYYLVSKEYVSHNGKIDIDKYKRSNTKKIVKINKSESTTKKLIKICSSILNKDFNDQNVSFYDLGGNSITTYILSNEIKRTFSISIDPTKIISCRTINALVQYIDKKNNFSSSEISNTIIKLNSNSEEALFLIHPIGGTIFWYLHLSKLLDKKIQIYAIQDPGILTSKTLFTSIEAMADCYTNYILSIKPNGPFLLGGASFGATVAIEIAKNLKKLGHSIQSVMIFDGWAQYPEKLCDLNYFKKSMERQQADWVGEFRQNLKIIENFSTLFEIQMHRLDILFKYKMQSFNFRIDIFKAHEIMPVFKIIDDPYNYWDKFSVNYHLHLVPGNHETMFFIPHIKTLSEKIIQVYKKINQKQIQNDGEAKNIDFFEGKLNKN